ncbi:MAG: thymidine kinase [bacterium]|nr:thymidine kinase [bacterium]
MDISIKNIGWIEVICGSMFSGKSEELIKRLRRCQIAKQKIAVFKPQRDTRYSETEIVSHNQARIPSISVRDSAELYQNVDAEVQVVGIDEAQFFDSGLVAVCEKLANEGKRVIVAGLDQDYLGRPFEPIPQLMAVAEYVTKALAICVVCGNPANRSYRKVQSEERILLGSQDTYEPRCRRCFQPFGEEKQLEIK